MKFTVKQKFILVKVDSKEKVNVYTLLNQESFDKTVLVGVKTEGLVDRSVVQAEIDIRVRDERITNGGQIQYVKVANLFVSSIQVVDQ